MTKRLLFIVPVLINALTSLFGQDNGALKTFEVAHIHSDRLFYQSGDIIWFKLYLTGQSNNKNDFSVIAYVDLLDFENNVLKRLKLKCSGGTSFGQIQLPDNLSTGIYTLKPFTLWMKNFFSENQFAQRILIYNVNDRTDPLPLMESMNADNTLNKTYLSNFNTIIETTKKKYGPRERIELNLTISGVQKLSDGGNFSITVREFEDSLLTSTPQQRSKIEPTQTPTVQQFPKERLVYPKAHNSIHKIENFSPAKLDSLKQTLSTNQIYSKQLLINQINATYQDTEPIQYLNLKPPSDITYYPSDFEAIETMRDFIREIIPQVKEFRRKNIIGIRIRNSENNQRIFFYHESPLLILDGYIIENIETLLNLEPKNIVSIDVAWRVQTINSAAVNLLADHGIFAVYTKQRLGEKLGLKKLYDDFHESATFEQRVYTRKLSTPDKIPDFRKTLYWNPHLDLNKNTKLSFYTSDDVGKFIIEIAGVVGGETFIVERKIIEVEDD